MRTTLILLLIALPGSSALLAQGAGTEDLWKPLRFLAGTWTGLGSGKPGEGSGSFTFSFDLHGAIMVRKSHTEYPPKPGEDANVHDDLLIIYAQPGGVGFRAHYFDNESHSIIYFVTSPPGDSVAIFETEVPSTGPRYKLLYTLDAGGMLHIEFLIAPPGKPYASYLKGMARRDG